MDPFIFDTKFARFVSQVDSDEIRQGTILYESGAARVSKVTPQLIEGFVKTRNGDSHYVKLQDNGEGGLSGSCTCDTFFNCSCAYALARATRDHLQRSGIRNQGSARGREDRPGPSQKSPSSTVGRGADPALTSQSKTPHVSSQSSSSVASLDTTFPIPNFNRLFSQTKNGKLPLYPNDLTPFTKDKRRPSHPPKEPYRELKRFLPDAGPKSAQDYADAIRAFCDQKGIPLSDDFKSATNPSHANARYLAYKKSQRDTTWKDAPPPLALDFSFEPTEDRDWFELTLVPTVPGHDFTREEINQLIKADGELVYLKGKGWRRIEKDAIANLLKNLAGLGNNPFSEKTQRLHVLQIEAIAGKVHSNAPSYRPIQKRLDELKKIKLPSPPKSLQSTLRPYQTEGFHFLTHLALRNIGGILADDMGLGKTLQTLTWLMWLKADKSNLRVLIVCPKSVTDNWIQESKKFKTGLKATLFSPSTRSVAPALAHGLQSSDPQASANLVVTNYSLLRLQADYFLKQKWDVAILDEGQYIKNPQSQTAKTAYKLNAKHRLILSGTPIENRVSDLWSLMQFAMPDLLGSQQSFITDFKRGEQEQALANLRKRIQPFLLRRLKTQVAKDLPERIEKDIRVELEGEQRELYQAELEKARQSLKQYNPNAPKDRFNILASLLRLRQLCCDPSLVQKSGDRSQQSEKSSIGQPASAKPKAKTGKSDDQSPSPTVGRGADPAPLPAKLQALLDLIDPIAAEGHQVLVFSQFVSMLEILKRELDQRNVGNLILSGKTQNRQALVDQFQKDKSQTVFLLSLKAAGSGLNLTAASYVILFDPWWNPAVEAQAIDRTHRIGQTTQVIAYRIIAKDTVEEKIRQLQRDKADLAESIIQEDSLAQGLNPEDLENLLS
ncbi:MAG: DEAD/DEAH box helicase [Verrucomicrobiota bacterium]